MHKSLESFVLLNGYVEINNEQLFLKLKYTEIKEKSGFVGILFALIVMSLYHDFKKTEIFSSVGDYISILLKIIGALVIIYLFYYLIFRKNWSKKLYINQIKRIDVDKEELETDVTIVFQNNRKKDLVFRTLENQVEPFIEALKKRNTRIEIKTL